MIKISKENSITIPKKAEVYYDECNQIARQMLKNIIENANKPTISCPKIITYYLYDKKYMIKNKDFISKFTLFVIKCMPSLMVFMLYKVFLNNL